MYFLRDREHSQGGGVFIAVSRDYLCTHEKDLENGCEILWVKVCMFVHFTILTRATSQALKISSHLLTTLAGGNSVIAAAGFLVLSIAINTVHQPTR